jgi:hypothetical protein
MAGWIPARNSAFVAPPADSSLTAHVNLNLWSQEGQHAPGAPRPGRSAQAGGWPPRAGRTIARPPTGVNPLAATAAHHGFGSGSWTPLTSSRFHSIPASGMADAVPAGAAGWLTAEGMAPGSLRGVRRSDCSAATTGGCEPDNEAAITEGHRLW